MRTVHARARAQLREHLRSCALVGGDLRPHAAHLEAALLFADLSGYTRLTRRVPARASCRARGSALRQLMVGSVLGRARRQLQESVADKQGAWVLSVLLTQARRRVPANAARRTPHAAPRDGRWFSGRTCLFGSRLVTSRHAAAADRCEGRASARCHTHLCGGTIGGSDSQRRAFPALQHITLM